MAELNGSTHYKGGDIVFRQTFESDPNSTISLANAIISLVLKNNAGTTLLTLSTPIGLTKLVDNEKTQTVRGVIPASITTSMPSGTVVVNYGFTITTADNVFRSKDCKGSFSYINWL